MKGVVGVVGLGIMGGAMARNLVRGGWEVVGFDVLAERRSEAEAAGILAANSAAAVAARAPTIIMSLPSAAAALAVARELAGAKESRVVVETSTLIWPPVKSDMTAAFSACGMRLCSRPTILPGSASESCWCVAVAFCRSSVSDSSISGQTQ